MRGQQSIEAQPLSCRAGTAGRGQRRCCHGLPIHDHRSAADLRNDVGRTGKRANSSARFSCRPADPRSSSPVSRDWMFASKCDAMPMSSQQPTVRSSARARSGQSSRRSRARNIRWRSSARSTVAHEAAWRYEQSCWDATPSSERCVAVQSALAAADAQFATGQSVTLGTAIRYCNQCSERLQSQRRGIRRRCRHAGTLRSFSAAR